jgi:hypothetical protein
MAPTIGSHSGAALAPSLAPAAAELAMGDLLDSHTAFSMINAYHLLCI